MSTGWKYVSKGSCINTLVWSIIIAALVLFVPIEFGAGGLKFTFKTLPLIGDGSFSLYALVGASGVDALLGGGVLPAEILYCYEYGFYFFFGILGVNIIFSILLLITKSNGLRMFCKVFSVLFGIMMLVLMLAFLLIIVGDVVLLISSGVEFMQWLTDSGIVSVLVLFIASLLMAIHQFKWFSNPYAILKGDKNF